MQYILQNKILDQISVYHHLQSSTTIQRKDNLGIEEHEYTEINSVQKSKHWVQNNKKSEGGGSVLLEA